MDASVASAGPESVRRQLESWVPLDERVSFSLAVVGFGQLARAGGGWGDAFIAHVARLSAAQAAPADGLIASTGSSSNLDPGPNLHPVPIDELIASTGSSSNLDPGPNLHPAPIDELIASTGSSSNPDPGPDAGPDPDPDAAPGPDLNKRSTSSSGRSSYMYSSWATSGAVGASNQQLAGPKAVGARDRATMCATAVHDALRHAELEPVALAQSIVGRMNAAACPLVSV